MSLSHGAAAPIAVLAAAAVFVVFCLVHLARAAQVRYLPKWAWVPIICLMIPWGGPGQVHQAEDDEHDGRGQHRNRRNSSV